MYVCVVVFMCTTLHMQGHPPPDLPLATLLQYSAQPSHTQSRTQPDLLLGLHTIFSYPFNTIAVRCTTRAHTKPYPA